jgi:hypothetical protein
MITSVQDGLEPDVISNWYSVIESEMKARCPTEELRDSIEVVQNLVLPMKFEFGLDIGKKCFGQPRSAQPSAHD